jgi:hypothetical protein
MLLEQSSKAYHASPCPDINGECIGDMFIRCNYKGLFSIGLAEIDDGLSCNGTTWWLGLFETPSEIQADTGRDTSVPESEAFDAVT